MNWGLFIISYLEYYNSLLHGLPQSTEQPEQSLWHKSKRPFILSCKFYMLWTRPPISPPPHLRASGSQIFLLLSHAKLTLPLGLFHVSSICSCLFLDLSVDGSFLSFGSQTKYSLLRGHFQTPSAKCPLIHSPLHHQSISALKYFSYLFIEFFQHSGGPVSAVSFTIYDLQQEEQNKAHSTCFNICWWTCANDISVHYCIKTIFKC